MEEPDVDPAWLAPRVHIIDHHAIGLRAVKKQKWMEYDFRSTRENSIHKITPLCTYLLSASLCPSLCSEAVHTWLSWKLSNASQAVLRTKSKLVARHIKASIPQPLTTSPAGLLPITSFLSANESDFPGLLCPSLACVSAHIHVHSTLCSSCTHELLCILQGPAHV